jgi:hypothetical protein
MGASQSSNLSVAVSELLYEQTTNLVNEISVTVSAVSSNINQISIKDAEFHGCDLTLSQTINSETASSGQITSENTSDISDSLVKTVDSQIDQAGSIENKGFFNRVFTADIQTNTQVLKDAVKKTITTTMESDTVAKIITDSQNINFNDLSGLKFFCTPENKLKIDQDIFSRSTAIAIVDVVVTNLMKDSTVQKFTNATKQTSSIKNIGITAGFIVAMIVLILVVYFIYKKMSKGGGPQAPELPVE